MGKTSATDGGIAVAPHYLASESGRRVLADGGSAMEAAVAMAATLAVVYPHMNSIGGDSFWLIAEPGRPPVVIDACGRAAVGADLHLYREAGLKAVPTRGPLAANTVAGTISGWQAVLDHSPWRLPLARLLEDAIHHASQGVAWTAGGVQTVAAKLDELGPVPGFVSHYLADGSPKAGDVLRQPALARTLTQLAKHGLDSFYRGQLGREIADELVRAGSPLSLGDLQAHTALTTPPLQLDLPGVRLFNTPPPTQGLASLMILGLFARLTVTKPDSFAHIHGLVEATKQAFMVRDRHVGDPQYMTIDPQTLLDDSGYLDALAERIDPAAALPWPQPASAGDTVWFGAIDRFGCAVSAIQSTYFEFGSGVVLPGTGIVWQNRGSSFRLAEDGWNALRPRRKPFHTLNPAMAKFDDGRTLAYGTMGGEGQPQTQAAVFSRHAMFGQDLQAAIDAPRWLLGRTWGEDSVTLKLEDRFDPAVVQALRDAGHDVELVAPMTSMMGHAGALLRHADGAMEGAFDPRSDGSVGAV
jgi:gamma-glutamyltranspeptidase/glutathione hydrolase